MATQKQIEANLRNAQKSSGPKSALGKLTSSANAMRHGLSVPLQREVVAKQIEELVALFADDGLIGQEARDLALKVLEYERNQERQWEIICRDPDFRELHAMTPVEPAHQEQESSDEYLGLLQLSRSTRSELALMGLSHMTRSDLRSIARLRERVLRDKARYDAKRDRDEATYSVRYLRRSSNQLIKAIRAL